MDNQIGLADWELALMIPVFQQHNLQQVILYGSRAMGRHRPGSDVDLAIVGAENGAGSVANDFRLAAAVEGDLDELPLPYFFDVQSLHGIKHEPLLDHIRRVGVTIYPEG